MEMVCHGARKMYYAWQCERLATARNRVDENKGQYQMPDLITLWPENMKPEEFYV